MLLWQLQAGGLQLKIFMMHPAISDIVRNSNNDNKLYLGRKTTSAMWLVSERAILVKNLKT